MNAMIWYLKSRSKIIAFLTLFVASGFLLIISQPKTYQIYNTYMQHLISSSNAKLLSANQIAELNRKFNLMDVSNEDVLPVTLVNNANSSNDCTIDNIIQKKMQQDHPCVIDYIRKNYMKKSPLPGTSLKLDSHDTEKRSAGQTNIILGLLKHQKNGFFVDCGAHDGEFMSNTIYLEHKYNWTGIMIEADPPVYKKLEERNRNGFLFPLCLSLESFPTKVSFIVAKLTGLSHVGGVKTNMNPEQSSVVTLNCFPFYSILIAAGRVDVDYFSLDVEGHELAILKTIPFHRVNIKSFSVEFDHIPEGLQGLTEFMENSGYLRATTMNTPSGGDAFFIKDLINNNN